MLIKIYQSNLILTQTGQHRQSLYIKALGICTCISIRYWACQIKLQTKVTDSNMKNILYYVQFICMAHCIYYTGQLILKQTLCTVENYIVAFMQYMYCSCIWFSYHVSCGSLQSSVGFKVGILLSLYYLT